jgi:K+-sensing histidine kinase KdpD
MLVAWFGGVGPGLLAAALAILAFDYYFVPPVNTLALEFKEIPSIILFAIAALFVVSLSGEQRSAAESLRRSETYLDEAQRLSHS